MSKPLHTVETSIAHLAARYNDFRNIAHRPDQLGQAFSQRTGFTYQGRASRPHMLSFGVEHRQAFHRLLGTIDLAAADTSYYLVHAARAQADNPRLSERTAEIVSYLATNGRSPMRCREAWTDMKIETLAIVLRELLAADGITVDVKADDQQSVIFTGSTVMVSQACSKILRADRDDRNIKRDGTRLANPYTYGGTPGSTEVHMDFHNGFGRYMEPGPGYVITPHGTDNVHYIHFWHVRFQQPGCVQFASTESSERHRADITNYGWRVWGPCTRLDGSIDTASAGPFFDLKTALAHADAGMTAFVAGKAYALPQPTTQDMAEANKLLEARGTGPVAPMAYSALLERFKEHNGIGERRPPVRRAA